MASFFEKAKALLDWLQHAYWIGSLLLSLGLGRATMAWLTRHVSLERDWETAIWLVFSGVFLWLLTSVGNYFAKKGQTKIVQSSDTTGTSAQLQAIEQVYKTYDSQLLNETETILRTAAAKHKAGDDRDTFLIRTLACGTILAFFESTWHSIFASQIKALERLNKGLLIMDDLLPYFQDGADKRPQYPFESWFGFLKQQVLVRQDGHNIGITVRGQEFLKYLVQSGRTWGDKPVL
jgi:hypothetical protein